MPTSRLFGDWAKALLLTQMATTEVLEIQDAAALVGIAEESGDEYLLHE